MAEQFFIGFEGVELVNGLGEDKPVWLFMRAALFNENDLNNAIWVDEVGSLPPDANRPVDAPVPFGDTGLYAPHLVRDQRVRNSNERGAPNFACHTVQVSLGQVLEVTVIMVPRVWLQTITVPFDELDKWTISIFVGLLGNFAGGGIVGEIVQTLLTALALGDAEQDVEVPCFNSIIESRHVFTLADLQHLRNQGEQRFGPRDNSAGTFCEPIDSYYWLSANNSGASFGTWLPEKQPGACTLEPRALRPLENELKGEWGDVGDRISDCVIVLITVNGRSADVIVRERHRTDPPLELTFHGAPISLGVPEPAFTRNLHRLDCLCRPCGDSRLHVVQLLQQPIAGRLDANVHAYGGNRRGAACRCSAPLRNVPRFGGIA